MATRRTLLMTGAASIVVAGLGGTWWGITGPAKTAREHWRRASEGFGDPRLDVIAYGILAPNPHNMQPWRVQLNDGLGFSIYCDRDRLLPEIDPPNRQITIGFGCFLELCRQTAAEAGYRADMTYFPEGEPGEQLDERPIAAVELAEDTAIRPDPLFSTVLARRTSRLEYDTDRPVEADMLSRLEAASVEEVSVYTKAEEGLVEELKVLAVDAWSVEWATQSTRRESIEVSRIGSAAVDANPYGLAFDDRMSSTLGLFGLMTLESLDAPESMAYRESFAFYERACRSAPAFAWSTTSGNTRGAQLDAGRAWVRVQLAANAAGLSFHPLCQALQEFPEMAEHYRRAHELLARESGQTVQMLVRLGYGAAVGAAPREALESKLIS
jgi:hypothetical protein